MNERIKELAKEAGYKHPEAVGSCEDYAYFDHEKFAELIVRECVGIAQEYDGAKLSGPGMIIAGRIETHFGVEE